jgi:hypothetical protein
MWSGGKSGHSTAGRVLEAAPFVLPLAAVGIVLGFGSKRRWRVDTVAWRALTIVVIGGMLEVFILLYEVGVHQCTQ